MSCISVAIDGPAGAGKSSVSKAVAQKLNFIYADTGAIYRAIAYYALKSGISIENEAEKVCELAAGCKIEIVYSDNMQHIIIDGCDVTNYIRLPEVSKAASDVSALPGVRSALLHIQRELAEKNNVIMDGRDIGTVVLPDADVKVFLTASIDERASRRYSELTEKGVKCSLDKIKADIQYRDKQDSERSVAPLKPADDAVTIDSSNMNFEQSVESILKLIRPLL